MLRPAGELFPSGRASPARRSDAGLLLEDDVQDAVQVRDLEDASHVRLELRHAQPLALAHHAFVQGHQEAEARAVDVLQLLEVQLQDLGTAR